MAGWQVVSHDDLLQRATEVATKFATSNLTALSMSKAMMHKHGGREVVHVVGAVTAVSLKECGVAGTCRCVG